MELLLDRLLSASTPTDCLDSLDQLQKQCRYRKPNAKDLPTNATDPKKQRPSQQSENEAAALKEAEAAETERQAVAIDTVLGGRAVLHALCSLISSCTLPSQQHGSSGSSGMEVEGGDMAACELLLVVLPSQSNQTTASSSSSSASSANTTEALQKQRQQKRRMEFISKTLLHFHDADSISAKSGGFGNSNTAELLALTPSLLDCLCATTSSVYARVLSLQTLQSLLSASPGVLREQLMQAPDGINRLVDLLGHGSSATAASMDGSSEQHDGNDVPEEVRNEAILFLTSLASSSSMLARLITFSEGYDRALKIALGSGSGLSSGSTIAIDCLELCLALAHADDVARELFLGGGDGRGNLDRLAQLVDLRGGERFRDKERNLWWDRELKEKKKMRKSTSANSMGDKGAALGGGEGDKAHSGNQGGGRGKRGRKQRKDDDLDDILSGASTSTTPAKKPESATQQSHQPQQNTQTEPQGPPAPYLTPNESSIVTSAFKLILVLLLDGEEDSTSPTNDASRAKRRGRAKTIMSHDLTRLIVDCALYTLPPPGVDFVSAVPPPKLQQKALVAMGVLGSLGNTITTKSADSEKGDDTAAKRLQKEKEEEAKIQSQLLFDTMPIYLHGQVTAIDRLMYLCCTGAYSPTPNLDDSDEEDRPEVVASLLSTYSVSAFRSCLPAETASRMVLHALAPPPPDETDATGMPLEPPVVTRLVTTFADNLRYFQEQRNQEASAFDMTNIYRATVAVSGSAGALGVFLAKGEGDATREMLLRLAPPPPVRPPQEEGADSVKEDDSNAEPTSLIDFILQHVSAYDPAAIDENLSASAAYVTATLLCLLCDWVIGMPRAVSEVLSSPSSVSLGVLVRSKKGGSNAAEAVPALSGLLLGLCLEYMADTYASGSAGSSAGDSPNMENIAWTKETIMNMVSSMGVGKYLKMIDQFKNRPLPLPYCKGMDRSSIERRAFASWYGNNVTLIRRCVVTTLAGSRGEDDSDSDNEGASAAGGQSSSSLRSLRKMVSSQMQEVEDLQTRLDEALLTIASQSTQVKELKRVTELGSSAETNDMIQEYTDKMAELEKVKAEVKKGAQAQAKLHEEALTAKDQEIEAVHQDLKASQDSVAEMRCDNETLAEEMSGLSAAYNTLEERYHRSSSSGEGDVNSNNESSRTEMTAGGETAAEDGGARNHSSAGGEGAAEDSGRSSSNTSYEIQSLRDENSQLREDVRAANEWMSMAVSKMDEMGRENETLSSSLDESRMPPSADTSSAVQGELDDLRQAIQSARKESESTKANAEAAMQAKEAELEKEKTLAQQLQEENEGLRKSTVADPQTSATETEMLQKELEQAKNENATLTTNLSEFQAWSETAQSRLSDMQAQLEEATKEKDELKNTTVASLENSLSEVTAGRDELKSNETKLKEEMTALEELNEELSSAKTFSTKDSETQDSTEKESFQKELEQVKAENATLNTNLSEFQAWSETAQGRLAEVNAQLQEAIKERDELKTQLDSIAPGAGTSTSEDDSLIQSLRKDISDKTEQLERMQDQLIEDADEHEATNEKLVSELEVAKERLDDLTKQEKSSAETIAKLTLEKEELSGRLADKQVEIESTSASKNDADMRAEEAQRRISELEAAKAAAEAQVDKLMAIENQHEKENLDEQIITITAERNELQSQLDDMTEEYDEASASLEKTSMENGNMVARNRALEQDNKSLEFQLESSGGQVIHEWEERVKTLEEEIETMQGQLEQQEKDAADAIAQWETRCESLESSGEGVIHQWEERVKALEEETETLRSQLEQQEKDAADAITQWEARCEILENSGGEVIQEWEERVKALEEEIGTLRSQLEQQESDAADAIAQWETRCASFENSGGEVIQQWEERVESLEEEIVAHQGQLAQQESDAAGAIAQWEARCASLEESGEGVIQQWEERVKSLEGEVETLQGQLEQQEKDAADAISQWEARCASVEESGEGVIQQWEERVKTLEEEAALLQNQLRQKDKEATDAIALWETKCLELEDSLNATKTEISTVSEQRLLLDGALAELKQEVAEKAQLIESMQLHMKGKDEAITSSDEQVSEMAKELTESQGQSEQIVKQWQERSEQLEANITELEDTMEQQEKEANDAIAQWEARCSVLADKIEVLEKQLAANDMDSTIADLNAEVSSLTAKLEVSKADINTAKENLVESKDLLALHVSEWEAKEASSNSTIEQLKSDYSDYKKKVAESVSSVESLKEKVAELKGQNTKLQQESQDALKESEASQVVVLELQEELRHSKEELQSYATDQFTVKATEMATQALRQQMVEIRSQYAVDQESLATEREARRVSEEDVNRLKSDLALLAQATEYNEEVDVYVRKIAKKVSAENVKADRKEMEELRSTLERLREELGSCRWKERESEEKASNARLHMSILEQEIGAAKADLALCEQAMEELENSHIQSNVSLEYRIEALENELLITGQAYEEDINGIKAELAQSNQDKDALGHKLEQSEKANAALVYSTSNVGCGGEESQSDVIKLQLERAQLLAKINEMGADLERRVRAAVAAQASSSEAELIVEKQARKSVESSLADTISDLDEMKSELAGHGSKTLASKLADKEEALEDLQESLDDMRMENVELGNKNKLLRSQIDTSDKENKSTFDELKTKLDKAEEQLRSEERVHRFEAAMASEIANLRASTNTSSNGSQKNSEAVVLQGIDQNMQPGALSDEGKESIDQNSTYIIEMYDYVVELKHSIEEERQMYKDLLAEHEDLLALLGQAGLDGMQLNASG